MCGWGGGDGCVSCLLFWLLFFFFEIEKNIKLSGQGGGEDLGGTRRGEKHDQNILFENIF